MELGASQVTHVSVLTDAYAKLVLKLFGPTLGAWTGSWGTTLISVISSWGVFCDD